MPAFRTLSEWSQMKTFLDNRSIKVQYEEYDEYYDLTAFDSDYRVELRLQKDLTSDISDFETNYKPSGNVMPSRDINITTVGAGSTGTFPCPTFSKKYRVELSETDVTMGSSYSTIYSYSGSGKFIGMVIEFNDEDVIVKVTIDSETIFELDIEDLNNFNFFGGGDDDDGGSVRSHCGLDGANKDKALHWCPPCPIQYDTEVKIEGKRNGGSNKTMRRRIVTLTKET